MFFLSPQPLSQILLTIVCDFALIAVVFWSKTSLIDNKKINVSLLNALKVTCCMWFDMN